MPLLQMVLVRGSNEILPTVVLGPSRLLLLYPNFYRIVGHSIRKCSGLTFNIPRVIVLYITSLVITPRYLYTRLPRQ